MWGKAKSEQIDVPSSPVHGESPPMTTERDEGCEEGGDES